MRVENKDIRQQHSNRPSQLLTQEENEQVFSLLGQKCQVGDQN